MDWQKGLKGLIQIFPNLKNFSPKLLNNIKIFSLNINKKVVEQKNSVIINWAQLEKEEKEKLLGQLPPLLKEGVDVLEGEFKETRDDYNEKINIRKSQGLIEFFLDKIPASDIPILKASLYLRSVLESKGETQRIKKDIMLRYGDRGKNISNLCSAGYFENWIRPLYEKMSKFPWFTKKRFTTAYNEIVTYYPFATFVHRGMSEEEVEKEIVQKIETREQYGVNILNIHGIGQDNVAKIRNVVDKLKPKIKFQKRIEEEGDIIVVKLTIGD